MSNFKNILYLIGFIIDSCRSLTFFDHRQYFDTSRSSVVMIAPKTLPTDALLDETMVQYGSMIHHRHILTFAEVLKGHEPEDTLVYADCYSDWYIFLRSCSMLIQALRFKMIEYYHSNSTKIKSPYGIIILAHSILFNSRVELTRLVVSDDIVNQSNCLMYSYIHHEHSTSFASYITPIKAQEVDGTYFPKLTKAAQLVDNNGRHLDLKRIFTEVSFYGSPILCALENSTSYVQVGISNLKIVFHSKTLSKENPHISQLSINFSPEEITRIWSFLPPPEIYSVVDILS